MSPNIGVLVSADYLPVDQIISFAPQLDNFGYSQASVPEMWGYDAFSLLTLLAYKTKSIKIATGIVNIFSRTPATMASTAVSIDNLSNGRLILGLGVSGPNVIEKWHGIPFNKPLTRTREYVSILRAIFSRERLNHTTTQLGTLKEFRISVRDVRADIPIHIASLGPKNIKLTAEIADGWIPMSMPLDAFEVQVSEMQNLLSLHHRDEDNFAITPFVPTLVGTDAETVELLRGHLAYYFGHMGTFYNDMLARSGFETEAETIMREWQKGNIPGARAAITDDLLDQMAIWGTPDHAINQLHKFIKAGANCPLLMLPFKTTTEQGLRTFSILAPNNESL